MIEATREELADAIARELLERGAKASAAPLETAAAILDRLEIPPTPRPPGAPPSAPHASPERGLVIAGEVVPATEWIRRDPAHWWSSGRGTRRRAETVDLLVGHWTAGEAGTRDHDGDGPLTAYDDDGPRVVRVMRGRKNGRTGAPLNVGIHFVIGACDPASDFAPIWQTADPGLTATVHLGSGWINARSIGVEVVSAGLPGPADVRRRPRARVPLLGREVEVLRFYRGQIATWVALAELLAALDGERGIRIPRVVPAFGADRRFTAEELRGYAGAMEHLHAPGTRKIDAGGTLIAALAAAGWALDGAPRSG